MCGGQRITVWYQLNSSVMSPGLRSPGLHRKCLYPVSYFACLVKGFCLFVFKGGLGIQYSVNLVWMRL